MYRHSQNDVVLRLLIKSPCIHSSEIMVMLLHEDVTTHVIAPLHCSTWNLQQGDEFQLQHLYSRYKFNLGSVGFCSGEELRGIRHPVVEGRNLNHKIKSTCWKHQRSSIDSVHVCIKTKKIEWLLVNLMVIQNLLCLGEWRPSNTLGGVCVCVCVCVWGGGGGGGASLGFLPPLSEFSLRCCIRRRISFHTWDLWHTGPLSRGGGGQKWPTLCDQSDTVERKQLQCNSSQAFNLRFDRNFCWNESRDGAGGDDRRLINHI